MKDENNWIKQRIKLYFINKSSLYACTKYSNDHKTLEYYIKYCEILRKVTKVAKPQHVSSLEKNKKITE